MAIVVSLILASFLVLAPALAADQIVKFSGDSASASFYSVSEDPCIATYAYVNAYDNVSKSPPPKAYPPPGGQSYSNSQVYVTVERANNCTGEYLYGWGVTTLAESAFVMTKQSATLNATVTVVDYYTGGSFDVLINLSWSATGDASRYISNYKTSSPHCKTSYRSDSTSYPASATGSISAGTINFTPESSIYATYGPTKSGSLTIGCGL